MENLLREIYNLQQQKDIFKTNIQRLNEQVAETDQLIENKKALLLEKIKDANISEFTHDDLVCIKNEKHSIGYKSESEVIELLKNRYAGNYLNVKISESIDKRALKKAIKENLELSSDLNALTEDKITEYLIVTTVENRARMIEHMEKN